MLIPFINFAGQADEAIGFYESIFDVKNKKVAYYKDMPADMKQHFPAGTEHYVLHAEMTINETQVWIGDSSQEITQGDMVTIAIPLPSKETVLSTFERLKADGTVLMEPATTFYSPLFGVIKDKFGVIWHLICRTF